MVMSSFRSRLRPDSSFANLTDEQLEAHMERKSYGDFTLTDAVRPSYNLKIVPTQGYRREVYVDQGSGTSIPVLIASVSAQSLLDVFYSLVEALGESVDVVLETSHSSQAGSHRDLYRDRIDTPVLLSKLYDFEEPLRDDGCAGIAVLNPRRLLEVQLDEHKLLFVYGQGLERFEAILCENGVQLRPDIRFIAEAEHVHSSSDEYQEKFEQLAYALGIDD